MNVAIVTGATSGIGKEITLQLLEAGWKVGVTGRNEKALSELKAKAPAQVYAASIDIEKPAAREELLGLIRQMDGFDMFVHCAGIGFYEENLDFKLEEHTAMTNAVGFVRMVGTAYQFAEAHPETFRQIVVISSIAGTKGLGMAPSYSATKRFQNMYVEALEQRARIRGVEVGFTDARPGFVDTPLLKGSRFPMLMNPQAVARSILNAARKRRRTVTIDWRYRMLVALWRLIPSALWVRMKIRK